MQHLLTEVSYNFPLKTSEFSNQFLSYLSLSSVGERNGNQIDLDLSKEEFFPRTRFVFAETNLPFVLFHFADGSDERVPIENSSGEERKSPHTYSPITLQEYIARIQPYPLVRIDHTGFNLPYFNGIHPTVLALREKLKRSCLYHTFPKHLEDASWDFILPGTREEIEGKTSVDYHQTRTPKIEIVSFDKSSTPLVQIDLQVEASYEEIEKLFPEGIAVPDVRQVWVYISNPFGVDFCLVVNEKTENDWSIELAKEQVS